MYKAVLSSQFLHLLWLAACFLWYEVVGVAMPHAAGKLIGGVKCESYLYELLIIYINVLTIKSIFKGRYSLINPSTTSHLPKAATASRNSRLRRTSSTAKALRSLAYIYSPPCHQHLILPINRQISSCILCTILTATEKECTRSRWDDRWSRGSDASTLLRRICMMCSKWCNDTMRFLYSIAIFLLTRLRFNIQRTISKPRHQINI